MFRNGNLDFCKRPGLVPFVLVLRVCASLFLFLLLVLQGWLCSLLAIVCLVLFFAGNMLQICAVDLVSVFVFTD